MGCGDASDTHDNEHPRERAGPEWSWAGAGFSHAPDLGTGWAELEGWMEIHEDERMVDA